MKKTIRFKFFQIVAEKGAPKGIPVLNMEESEINILWTLCRDGPKSIYDLREKTKFQLQLSWPKRVWIQLPNNLTASEAREMAKDLQKPKSYQRSSIRNVVNELSVKNLVEPIKDTSGARIKTIVKPTFQGLVLYLQNPFEEGRLEDVFEHYSKLVPFFSKWDEIKSKLGKEKCKNALEQTVMDFVEIRRVKFQVRSLRLKFEWFLESPKMFMREAPEVDTIREIDTDVAQYLRSKEALLLKKSYIAYLIVHDIHRLSGESKERVKQIVSKLESEKELAYLESKQTEANLLFKDNRLKEFVPENADIGHFFTGMFVKNLLWNEKIIEKKKEEAKASDYEVEFY